MRPLLLQLMCGISAHTGLFSFTTGLGKSKYLERPNQPSITLADGHCRALGVFLMFRDVFL